jgi:peptide chain release factor
MDENLSRRFVSLGIREEDLEEQFIRGSGPGGQKINKVSSTVLLRHVPSGLEIRCQRTRSQVMNRHWARVELCEQLEAERAAAKLSQQQAAEKKLRQNRAKPKAVKRKMVEGKRQRAQIKQGRSRQSGDE